MPVTIIKRLDSGAPLTPAQVDQNWQNIKEAIEALQNSFTVALNADGTIKAGSINNVNIFSAAVLAAVQVPVGSVLATTHPTLGTNAGADGWIYADGTAVSRTGNFANYFALVGVTYGPGNGTTTFNLPDYRARTMVGTSPGSLSMGRDTARTLASEVATQLGKETHKLIESEMPPHAHGVQGKEYAAGEDETPTLVIIDDDYNPGDTLKTRATTTAGGSGIEAAAHENMQPSAVIRWLVKL